MSYEPQAKILNKKIHKIYSNAEDNWHINPEKLDKVCKKIYHALYDMEKI